MKKRRILYVVLLAVNLYLSLIYYYRGLRFLLAFAVFLPLVSWLELLGKRFLLKWEMDMEELVCTRGKNAEVVLRFRNRSFLPISRICVELEWSIPGDAPKKRKEWIQGLNEQEELRLGFPAEHCGKAVLQMKKIRLYDYLGISSISVRCRNQAELLIAPEIEQLDISELDRAMAPGLVLAQGADDLEGYHIRDYRQGDSLHRVHWKLSARTEELQIRDFESFRQGGRAVLLCIPHGEIQSAALCRERQSAALCRERQSAAPRREKQSAALRSEKQSAEVWDRYLDKAFSLLFSMYYGECGLEKVFWQEGSQLSEQEIVSEEDIYTCMYRLLGVTAEENSGRKERDSFEIAEEAGVLRLEMDGKLYMGEQYLYEI